jgi:copper(I)-binding protein
MRRLTRLRMFEIGVAVLLTLAALVFIGLTVWAAEPGIHVADAWARPSLGETTMSAAYMNIVNNGEADTLNSARSELVEAIEMHQTTMSDDGVMQMRKVEGGLPVPSQGTLAFASGGMHLMLVGLKQPLEEGGDLPMTLEFEHAGAIDVRVPVRATAPEH